jgi:hypothetical protein
LHATVVEFHAATVHDMVRRGVCVDTAVIHYARACRTLPDCDARQRASVRVSGSFFFG